MQVRILPAFPEDAPAIVAVHIACWRQNYAGLIEQSALDSIEESEWLFRRQKHLAHPDRIKLIAKDESGNVLGFADAGQARDSVAFPDFAEIYAFYVDPAAQGLGLGKKLFAAMKVILVKEGFANFYVKTLGTNSASRSFYEGRGGELAGEGSFEFGGKSYPEVAYRYSLT